jgi:PAP2 superfamily
MLRKSVLLLVTLTAAASLARAQTPFNDAFGTQYQLNNLERNPLPRPGLEILHRWNKIAIDASGLDHTPVASGESRTFGEQLGPGRASRAIAIVHIAMFDAYNAIDQSAHSFTHFTMPRGPFAPNAAVAQAAHDTLAALFPSQSPSFDARLNEDLGAIKNATERANGIELGKRAAAAILAARVNDGAEEGEPKLGDGWTTSDQPGHWRQDPISQSPVALGAHWGACKTFVLTSGAQFRLPAPPGMTSAVYTAAYNEVKRLGGDGVTTPTERTADQTFIGTFWAYDGTPSLCAPPRLYNQIVVTIADQTNLTAAQFARLLALTNVAMADAAMAAWDSKFYWDYWRPITGIRESDVGTGPSGQGDGNPDTVGDPNFRPLGAPASNLTGPNFTPPFPSYPSGHATIGGALFEVLRRFYNTDHLPFTFVSDEFNGVTRGNDGQVRPYMPRRFELLSDAESENARSRIYLGIHWDFDATDGIALGREVGGYVFDHAFRPGSDRLIHERDR